mgnify:CR=1 FL=1
MDWDAIGALGEVLGAVSVLITLLYLSRQISASNKALDTTGATAMMEGYNEFNTWSISTEELAQTSRHFYNEPEEPLSEFEKHKLSVMARVFVNQIYKLFLLHKAGSMPADQWAIAATEADQILNLTEFGRTFRKENVAYWQMWEEMDKLESKDLSKF